MERLSVDWLVVWNGTYTYPGRNSTVPFHIYQEIGQPFASTFSDPWVCRDIRRRRKSLGRHSRRIHMWMARRIGC